MRVVVTGGRHYGDWQFLFDTLDEIHAEDTITLLAHGACKDGGADILAEDWAKSREIPYMGVPAKWNTGGRGRAEGQIRNGVMLDLVKPDLVVAFTGGAGTAGCVKQADKRGIVVDDRRDFTDS